VSLGVRVTVVPGLTGMPFKKSVPGPFKVIVSDVLSRFTSVTYAAKSAYVYVID
jgi:hypothetical protein